MKDKYQMSEPRHGASLDQTLVNPFTVDEIRHFITKDVLKPTGQLASLRMPSKEAMMELTDNLNEFQRFFYLENGPWKISNEEQTRALAAIVELIDVLPKIQDNWANLLDFSKKDRGFLEKTAQRNLETLATLSNAIGAAQQTPSLWINSVRNRFEKWTDLGQVIADAFQAAMDSTNPGPKLGRSGVGPIPRFIAAVVPKITGENPTPGGVGKNLSRVIRASRDNGKA